MSRGSDGISRNINKTFNTPINTSAPTDDLKTGILVPIINWVKEQTDVKYCRPVSLARE